MVVDACVDMTLLGGSSPTLIVEFNKHIKILESMPPTSVSFLCEAKTKR